MNILIYLDEVIENSLKATSSYPEFLSLSLPSIKKLEIELKKIGETMGDDYSFWREFKTNGLLNNYRGIPIRILDKDKGYA